MENEQGRTGRGMLHGKRTRTNRARDVTWKTNKNEQGEGCHMENEQGGTGGGMSHGKRTRTNRGKGCHMENEQERKRTNRGRDVTWKTNKNEQGE